MFRITDEDAERRLYDITNRITYIWGCWLLHKEHLERLAKNYDLPPGFIVKLEHILKTYEEEVKKEIRGLIRLKKRFERSLKKNNE